MKMNYRKYADTLCLSMVGSPKELVLLLWVENWRSSLKLCGMITCFPRAKGLEEVIKSGFVMFFNLMECAMPMAIYIIKNEEEGGLSSLVKKTLESLASNILHRDLSV
jgi:hypothetical protein